MGWASRELEGRSGEVGTGYVIVIAGLSWKYPWAGVFWGGGSNQGFGIAIFFPKHSGRNEMT